MILRWSVLVPHAIERVRSIAGFKLEASSLTSHRGIDAQGMSGRRFSSS
jgi:hypothetical protein